MLKVDSMNTSRGTESTKSTTHYVLPVTKSEDCTEETRTVYDCLREFPAMVKINPAGKIKLEIRDDLCVCTGLEVHMAAQPKASRLRDQNEEEVVAIKTNEWSYADLVKTLEAKSGAAASEQPDQDRLGELYREREAFLGASNASSTDIAPSSARLKPVGMTRVAHDLSPGLRMSDLSRSDCRITWLYTWIA